MTVKFKLNPLSRAQYISNYIDLKNENFSYILLQHALRAHSMGKFCHLKRIPFPARLKYQAAIVAREQEARERFEARETRVCECFKARVVSLRFRKQVDGYIRRRPARYRLSDRNRWQWGSLAYM